MLKNSNKSFDRFVSRLPKIIRILTLAPLMAFFTLTILYICRPEIFGGVFQYIMSIIFLTVLPILAYPLQPIFPKFKDQGRIGQRNLAIIMAVIGYILGVIFAILSKAPVSVIIIYMGYLASGVVLSIFNKFLKIKASGHACGVAGPLAILVYFLGANGFWTVLILPVLYWSCIKMRRHSISELIFGTVIPVISFLAVVTFMG